MCKFTILKKITVNKLMRKTPCGYNRVFEWICKFTLVLVWPTLTNIMIRKVAVVIVEVYYIVT